MTNIHSQMALEIFRGFHRSPQSLDESLPPLIPWFRCSGTADLGYALERKSMKVQAPVTVALESGQEQGFPGKERDDSCHDSEYRCYQCRLDHVSHSFGLKTR